MLTHERLKDVLRYEVATGIFTWKKILSNRGARGSIAGWDDTIGRRVIRIDKKNYFAHRLAFLYMMGRWPSDQIDHINGDWADNRWKNLREATASENHRNSLARSNNKLGIKGVRFQAGKYEVNITIDRRLVYLGRFKTVEEADSVFKVAAEKHHGSFAGHLNRRVN